MWYVVRLGTISTKTVKNAIGAVLLLVKLNKRDCNWTRTHNHLVRKRTLNHLAKLASCSHLNFRFCACFEQGFLWHPGNYRVWIHFETRTWHDKNIQLAQTCFKLYKWYKIAQSITYVFIWRKDNALLSRYIDFCISVKSTDFKICDVIISIAA